MKQHTINLLLENSVYLQELKIAIPEEEVKIDNIVYGKGTAHSKKEAEQEAAKDALKKSVNNE
mgnify:CR=1 FL=1